MGNERLLTGREDVHDFAWTASGDLLEFEDEWRHVKLKLMLQPEHAGQVERHFEAAKIGLEYFDKWVGAYPYTTLTLVDGIGGSNGMEYPTLITCGYLVHVAGVDSLVGSCDNPRVWTSIFLRPFGEPMKLKRLGWMRDSTHIWRCALWMRPMVRVQSWIFHG